MRKRVLHGSPPEIQSDPTTNVRTTVFNRLYLTTGFRSSDFGLTISLSFKINKQNIIGFLSYAKQNGLLAKGNKSYSRRGNGETSAQVHTGAKTTSFTLKHLCRVISPPAVACSFLELVTRKTWRFDGVQPRQRYTRKTSVRAQEPRNIFIVASSY